MNDSRIHRIFWFVILLGSLTLVPRSGVRAGWIASNLGPDQSFDLQTGYELTGPNASIGLGYSLAVEFQVSGTSSVEFGSAQLALEYHSGINSLAVLLMSDAGGIPGEALDTMDVADLSSSPTLVTVFATTSLFLNSGVNYWLVAVASNNTDFSWMRNNQGFSGHLGYEMNHGSGPLGWETSPGSPDLAFQIDSVHEIPSSELLGLGLIVVGSHRFGIRRFGRILRYLHRGCRRRIEFNYYRIQYPSGQLAESSRVRSA